MLVSIALLLTLGCLEPAPDLLNHLSSLEYHFGNPYESLTDLTPTNWGPTFPSIELLKRRPINVGVVVVVIRKFR